MLSSVWLFVTPSTVACQAPLSMEFSRQEYWSGLPCPSPGDLSNPEIKSGSPALQADSLPSEPPRKPRHSRLKYKIYASPRIKNSWTEIKSSLLIWSILENYNHNSRTEYPKHFVAYSFIIVFFLRTIVFTITECPCQCPLLVFK